MPMKVRAFGVTDIGKVREENQDAFFIDEKAGLFVVADGMGGMEEGARAAHYVVQGLAELVKKRLVSLEGQNQTAVSQLLQDSIQQVSIRLSTAVSGGTGSTVVIVFLMGMSAFVANLGDSPAYLFRDGSLVRLTRDYSLAGLMAEMGKITPEQARTHPMRHRLTAYVGMEGIAPVNLKEITVVPGDRFLLCTDGLTGMVAEETIARVLGEEKDVEVAVRKLVNMANEAGGYDNIAVIVIDIEEV